MFLQNLGINGHQYIAPIIVPLNSTKIKKINLYEGEQFLTIEWEYEYRHHRHNSQLIEPKTLPLTRKSLKLQLRIDYDGEIFFSYEELPVEVKEGIINSLLKSNKTMTIGLSSGEETVMVEPLDQLESETGVMFSPVREVRINGQQFYNISLQPRSPHILQNSQHRKFSKIDKPQQFEIQLPFKMTFFEEPFKFLTIKRSGLMLFGGEALKYLKVMDIKADQLLYGALNLPGTACLSVVWSGPQQAVQSLLCSPGQVILQFENVTTEDWEEEVGLFHGVYQNNKSLVNMARSLIPKDMKAKIKTHQVIFSPRSSCSMSTSCLSSLDCDLFSILHQCGRFSCMTPSSPSSCFPSSPAEVPHNTAGSVTIVLMVMVVMMVLLYLAKRRGWLAVGGWSGWREFRSEEELGESESQAGETCPSNIIINAIFCYNSFQLMNVSHDLRKRLSDTVSIRSGTWNKFPVMTEAV